MLQVQKQCLSILLRDLGLPSWEFSKSKSDWSAVSYTFTLTPCQIIIVLRLATHERAYLSVERAEAGDRRKNSKGWRRRRRMERWRETALPPIINELFSLFHRWWCCWQLAWTPCAIPPSKARPVLTHCTHGWLEVDDALPAWMTLWHSPWMTRWSGRLLDGCSTQPLVYNLSVDAGKEPPHLLVSERSFQLILTCALIFCSFVLSATSGHLKPCSGAVQSSTIIIWQVSVSQCCCSQWVTFQAYAHPPPCPSLCPPLSNIHLSLWPNLCTQRSLLLLSSSKLFFFLKSCT